MTTIRVHRVGELLAAGALAATALAWTAAPAAASPAGNAAVILGAHLSPNTASVDVYLTAFAGGRTTFWLSDVGYGDVSGYRRITPGPYVVAMRPHGAPASTPAALSWRFTAEPGHAYTVAAVGMNAHLRGIVLADDLQPPPPGHARVRVIQAASRAPRADVTLHGGAALVTGLPFAAASGYVTVPAGTWRVDASASGGSPATSGTVRIASGGVASLVLLDGKHGGLTLRILTDAAGARAEPSGPVPAGGGGTAPRPSADPSAALRFAGLAGIVLAFAGLLGLNRSRRRAVAPPPR
jgi:hypothetical protein